VVDGALRVDLALRHKSTLDRECLNYYGCLADLRVWIKDTRFRRGSGRQIRAKFADVLDLRLGRNSAFSMSQPIPSTQRGMGWLGLFLRQRFGPVRTAPQGPSAKRGLTRARVRSPKRSSWTKIRYTRYERGEVEAEPGEYLQDLPGPGVEPNDLFNFSRGAERTRKPRQEMRRKPTEAPKEGWPFTGMRLASMIASLRSASGDGPASSGEL